MKNPCNSRIFLDGAGGTQVPQMVIDAMFDYFVNNNAITVGETLGHPNRWPVDKAGLIIS